MSEIGSKSRPAQPNQQQQELGEEPRYAGGSSVDRDRAWAQNRIANFFKGQQSGQALIQRKKDDKTKDMPRTTSGRVPTVEPIPAGNEEQDAKTKKQRNQQLRGEQNLSGAEKHEKPFQPLSPEAAAKLEAKVEARTATPEEHAHLEWDRRFGNRRDRGVARFWAQEKKKLDAGQPPSRPWTPEQAAHIKATGKPPKDAEGIAMEGHHMHNANDYPANAADPKNITPVTKEEHQHMWHGGNWKNETAGKPLNPGYVPKGKGSPS